MRHELTVFLFTLGLFLGMLLFLEIGRRIAIRRMKEDAGAWRGRESVQWMGRFLPCWVYSSLLHSPERVRDLTRAGS